MQPFCQTPVDGSIQRFLTKDQVLFLQQLHPVLQLSYSRQFTAVHIHSELGDLHHLLKITILSVTCLTTSKHHTELIDIKTFIPPTGRRVVSCLVSGQALSPTKHLRLTHAQSCHFPNASASQKGVTGDYGIPQGD